MMKERIEYVLSTQSRKHNTCRFTSGCFWGIDLFQPLAWGSADCGKYDVLYMFRIIILRLNDNNSGF